jgi:hypothetical protein
MNIEVAAGHNLFIVQNIKLIKASNQLNCFSLQWLNTAYSGKNKRITQLTQTPSSNKAAWTKQGLPEQRRSECLVNIHFEQHRITVCL